MMERERRETEHLDPVPTDVGRALSWMALARIVIFLLVFAVPIVAVFGTLLLYFIVVAGLDLLRYFLS